MKKKIIDNIEKIETTKENHNFVVSKKKRKITLVILISILIAIVIGIVALSFVTSKTPDGSMGAGC